MKTLRGARLNDMRPYESEGRTYAQAAFRWVLSSPRVDALVISMTDIEKIDEFVAASEQPDVRGEDFSLLTRYAYLQDAISLLPERHRLVIVGYFLEERTSVDLARFLGVTESRVSQLRSDALEIKDFDDSEFTIIAVDFILPSEFELIRCRVSSVAEQ